jgi:hypothetical protein
MNVFRIRTTDWQENDFLIMTSLDERQVRKVIEPMVIFNKENDEVINPEDYVMALISAYPKAVVVSDDNFETIKF